MTIAFIAVLKVKPEMVEQFEKAQRELSIFANDEEPGVYVYDLIRQQDDPLTYVCYARFKDETAYEIHMAAEPHDRLVPPILESLAEDMQLTIYEHVA